MFLRNVLSQFFIVKSLLLRKDILTSEFFGELCIACHWKTAPIYGHFCFFSELDSSRLQVLCLFSIVFSILELNPSSKLTGDQRPISDWPYGHILTFNNLFFL